MPGRHGDASPTTTLLTHMDALTLSSAASCASSSVLDDEYHPLASVPLSAVYTTLPHLRVPSVSAPQPCGDAREAVSPRESLRRLAPSLHASSATAAAAARAVAALAHTEAGRAAARSPGVFHALLSLLSPPAGADANCAAAEALFALADGGPGWAEGVAALVPLLLLLSASASLCDDADDILPSEAAVDAAARAAAAASAAVARLCAPPHFLSHSLLTACSPAPLAQCLYTQACASAHADCARALAWISATQLGPSCVRLAGGIPPLVQLIGAARSSAGEAEAAAVACLRRLASCDDANRCLIRESGGLARLARLVSDPSADIGLRCGGAAALRELVEQNARNRSALREAGGVAALVSLLALPAAAPPPQRTRAARRPADGVDAYDSPRVVRLAGASSSIACGGGGSGSPAGDGAALAAATHAAACLRSLFRTDAGATRDDLCACAGVPRLVALLSSGAHLEVVSHAAACLAAACDCHHAGNISAVIACGGVPILMGLVGTPSDVTPSAAACVAVCTLVPIAGRVADACRPAVDALVMCGQDVAMIRDKLEREERAWRARRAREAARAQSAAAADEMSE